MKSDKQFSNQGNGNALGQARSAAQEQMSTPDYLLNSLSEQNFDADSVAQIMDNLPPGQIVRYFAQNGLDALFPQPDDSQDDSTEDSFGSNAVALELGTALDANIDEGMESDLYSVELEEGVNYSFNVTSDELSSPYLILRDSDGERIASDLQESDETGATITFTAPQSGVFYLDFSDTEDQASGAYSINVTTVEEDSTEDETGSETEDGSDVVDGEDTETENGSDAEAGEGTETEDGSDVVAEEGSETPEDETVVEDSSDVEVGNETIAEDLTADSTTAGAIAANSEVEGSFEQANDSDWFAMDFKAGTEYTMTLSSDNAETPAMVLRDTEGQTVENNFNITGDDLTITFTAEEAGSYFLDVSDLSGAASGDYTIAVASDAQDLVELPELNEDDISADALTTSLLDMGGTVASSIDFAGDEDWFTTSFEAGTTYNFAIESDSETAQLAVMDSNGELAFDLSENDDGMLSFTAEESGSYFIAASDANPDATGNYLIGVQQQTADDVIA